MQTIRSLQSVLDTIQTWTSDSLVLFDIDETCLHAGEGYGSETWYDQVIQSYLESGMDFNQAVLKANDLWESKQDDLQYFITEPVLITILDHCASRAIPTMGLTARRVEMAEATRKQLLGLNVDLLKTARIRHGLLVAPEIVAENGIIFGGPLVDKGQALASFLEVAKIHPKQIAFVDDKPYHLKSVQNVCSQRAITAFCFHYQRPR